MQTIIGIDNGVTGSIAILTPDVPPIFTFVRVFKVRNYTKEEQHINRIDTDWLVRYIYNSLINQTDAIAVLERPMVNYKAKSNTVSSALRALEATAIVLESLKIPYSFMDSKQWQSHFFGASVSGRVDLKRASRDLGASLFPALAKDIIAHKDADALLIAHYYKEVLCTS